MPEIKVVPLGAGQDVGRSCILVSIGGRNIMFDSGMHMGFNDERRFPDLSYITKEGTLDEFLDCVIISHFHLDHCGALPYMSEMVGFSGPVYMTHPTKAICPVLLEDYRKIQVERKDLLISESTYATTIRDSKRARERDFLTKVHECVDRGGKVLIPVFALGRAQELFILLESYWERMDLKGLAERATNYYKLFVSWTNEKIKKTFVERNMFDFKHILPFEKSYVEMPGPMVIFATPGMLHGGNSLKIFKRLAPDEKNMIVMPGYCVAGTVGHQVINGAKRIHDGPRDIDVKLDVKYMSFSAHADAKGIMQLIRNCGAKNLVFVHGEKEKMEFLSGKVAKEFNIPVYCPANGESVSIHTEPDILLDVSSELLKRSMDLDPHPSKKHCPFQGTMILDGGEQSH